MQIQQALSYYSTKLSSSKETITKNEIQHTHQNTESSIKISDNAWAAYQNSMGPNWQQLFEKIDSDPKYAEQFVRDYTSYPDLQLAPFSLKDIQNTSTMVGPGQYKMSEEQNRYYLSGQDEADRNFFSQMSSSVLQKRQDIFNEMSANGAKSSDIFHAIMEFNRNLPERYQKMAGLLNIPPSKSNTYA